MGAAALAALAADPAARPAPKPAPQKTIRVALAPVEDSVQVQDLTARLDNGKAARIVRVRHAKDELLVLLVMDAAGDLSLADSARNAFIEHLQTLPATTWTALMRAQDGLQVILDPTPDRDKVASALRQMPVAGKAGLLDTVEAAAALADSIGAKSSVRVAILYITDSDVRNYREDFTNPVINSSDSRDLSRRFPEGLIREKTARLTETLTRYQTPVFIVHLDFSGERLDQAYQSGLMQLASATGGSAVFCRSQAEIPDAVTRTLDAIQAAPQVWVQLPPKAPTTIHLFLENQGRSLGHRSRFVLK